MWGWNIVNTICCEGRWMVGASHSLCIWYSLFLHWIAFALLP